MSIGTNRLFATPDSDDSIGEPFVALCEQVLNTSLAYLVPAGATAAFVQPQSYPAGRGAPNVASLPPLPDEGETPLVPVDAATYGGATWAVPLRRERVDRGVAVGASA